MDDEGSSGGKERETLVEKHGFDNVMRGLLAVKPKTEKKSELKKRKGRTTEK